MRRIFWKYRHRLRRVLVDGPARKLVGPVHDSLIALELSGQALADRRWAPPPPAGLDGLTAVVKTFERPRALRRLLDSLRCFHPELPIVVVDDSRAPEPVPGVELVRQPFDSGVSAGRNAGLARVKTELFLLLDDDFVFHRRSGLARARLAACRRIPRSTSWAVTSSTSPSFVRTPRSSPRRAARSMECRSARRRRTSTSAAPTGSGSWGGTRCSSDPITLTSSFAPPAC